MGLYGWCSDDEFERYSHVTDKEINEALQEVREVMPEWYIDERIFLVKSWWFGKEKQQFYYSVKKRLQPDQSDVRIQISATDKKSILNLLYGLLMGYHKGAKTFENEKNKGS